jgi:hypothetical protein
LKKELLLALAGFVLGMGVTLVVFKGFTLGPALSLAGAVIILLAVFWMKR